MNALQALQDQPIIRVFADFGRYSHDIRYPDDHKDYPSKYPSYCELIPAHLYDRLDDWSSEFAQCASDDCFGGKPGKMLWVSFDLAGMKIAKDIKAHVGDKARVVYMKPSEDPFSRYDYAREILTNGAVIVLPRGV